MSLSLTEREEILERAVAKYTAQGYVIKTLTQTDAVLTPSDRKKSIAQDGCLTVIWLGFWIIPATIAAATGSHSKVTIHVKTDGELLIVGRRLGGL